MAETKVANKIKPLKSMLDVIMNTLNILSYRIVEIEGFFLRFCGDAKLGAVQSII